MRSRFASRLLPPINTLLESNNRPQMLVVVDHPILPIAADLLTFPYCHFGVAVWVKAILAWV